MIVSRLAKIGVLRLFAWQSFLLLILAIFLLSVQQTQASMSVLLGGFCYLLPNLVFASKAFKFCGALFAKQIASSIYRAEAIKITLTMLLFSLVFIFININALAFFGSFMLAQMVHWFAPRLVSSANLV